MDMVSSAIIACSEPKIASFQLLKSYIKEYHSEFGIDTRPSLLKNAIARALKKEMIMWVYHTFIFAALLYSPECSLLLYILMLCLIFFSLNFKLFDFFC